jgi:hypothetical protein
MKVQNDHGALQDIYRNSPFTQPPLEIIQVADEQRRLA